MHTMAHNTKHTTTKMHWHTIEFSNNTSTPNNHNLLGHGRQSGGNRAYNTT